MGLTTELQRQKIKEIITFELLKRGISTSLLVEEKDNKLDLVSTPFQTTPILFKQIIISDFGSWIKQQEDFIQVTICVNAFFTLFDGGTNGVSLFTVTLNCFDNDVRLINCI